ncbi:MAG TPA: extracellular solute-binding protein [Treponemataceae bacterium]|nr:extracellular solute-binding protein [Treponemataceae bacterium]
MKNKILTAILLLVIPLFLTACSLSDIPVIGKYFGGGSGNAPKQGVPVSLNMWGLWETPDIMEVLIKNYQTQNSLVTVNYEDRSINNPNSYKESVFTRIKQGDLPDIIMVHNSWVPFLKDYLEPAPSDVIATADYLQRFYPVAAESSVVDGRVYAVPAHHDGLVLVYNKDHFDEIDQVSPPTAWEEFRRVALALTIRTNEEGLVRAGAAIGSANNIDFFSDIVGLMFAQAGVSVPSGIDSRAAQDALSFYTIFLKSDEVWSESFPEASKAFSAGKVSMIFVPTWNLLDIVRANPGMNIGVAPVPQAVAERPVSWGSFWMYAVPKSGSNSRAAWEFINFISKDDQQLALFNEASKYRPYGAPFSSVTLAQQAGQSASSQYIKPILNTAPFAKSSVFAARAGNTTEVEALRTAVNAVLSGEVTSEQALKTCKETIVGTQQ